MQLIDHFPATGAARSERRGVRPEHGCVLPVQAEDGGPARVSDAFDIPIMG